VEAGEEVPVQPGDGDRRPVGVAGVEDDQCGAVLGGEVDDGKQPAVVFVGGCRAGDEERFAGRVARIEDVGGVLSGVGVDLDDASRSKADGFQIPAPRCRF